MSKQRQQPTDDRDIFEKVLDEVTSSSPTGMYMPAVYGGLIGAGASRLFRKRHVELAKAQKRLANAKSEAARKRAADEVRTIKGAIAMKDVKGLTYGTMVGGIAGNFAERHRGKKRK